MSTALIIVDVQNDFLPGGALGAEDGDKVIEPLLLLAQEVDQVIATRDVHSPNHVSFSDSPTFEDGSWPRHCVIGTKGVKLHPEIDKVADVRIDKGDDVQKEAYSGFQGHVAGSSETLLEWLERHDIDTVIVGGLVAEYCVKNTAIDAASEGFRTVVNSNAVAALAAETESEAYQEMGIHGVRISDRVPRGGRATTREEAVQDAINAIVDEAEDAEGANYHALSAWYGNLIKFVKETPGDEALTLVFPNAFLEEIKVIRIPAGNTEQVPA